MINKAIRFYCAGLYLALCPQPALAALERQCSGIWSSEASPFYADDDPVPTDIPAPTGDYSLHVSDGRLVVVSARGVSTPLDLYLNAPLVEATWSPDARMFALTASDGGSVGSWEVTTYSLKDQGSVLRHDFQHALKTITHELPDCEEPEAVNLGFIKWLDNGKEALLVAEVAPHSSCKNMGDVQGFRVRVDSGKVLEKISAQRLHERWSESLGCRF